MNHWLMKSEPDAFGIDDLARVRIEPWTGVRNYQARNTMRDLMRVGDAVLFYHSNATPPGVAGLARVVKTGVVDATQFDPASPYYDPGSTRDAPRWICVDVAFERKLDRLIALDELRANPGLDGMVLLARGSRLSVQPVTAAHYQVVLAMEGRAATSTTTAPAKTKAKAKTKTTAKAVTTAKPGARAQPAAKAPATAKPRGKATAAATRKRSPRA